MNAPARIDGPARAAAPEPIGAVIAPTPAPAIHLEDVDLSVRRPQRSVRRAGHGQRRSAPEQAGRRSAVGVWVALALLLALAAGAYVVHLAGQDVPPGNTPGSGTPGGDGPGGGGPGGGTGPPTPVFGMDRITVSTGTAGELRIEVDWTELSIAIVCGDRVWLRAVSDGGQPVEGTYAPGATISLTAVNRVDLRIGRARPTRIVIGGIDIGPAGDRDDARTVVIVRRQ